MTDDTQLAYDFDPEIAAVVPLLPSLESDDPAAMRAAFSEMIAQMPAPDTSGLRIEDREIPGRAGDPAVPVRIYRPDERSGPAAVYTVHGGGFVVGDLETEHGIAARLAREFEGPHIAFQFLSVPELDDRLTTKSMTEFVDTPLWNRPRAIEGR